MSGFANCLKIQHKIAHVQLCHFPTLLDIGHFSLISVHLGRAKTESTGGLSGQIPHCYADFDRYLGRDPALAEFIYPLVSPHLVTEVENLLR